MAPSSKATGSASHESRREKTESASSARTPALASEPPWERAAWNTSRQEERLIAIVNWEEGFLPDELVAAPAVEQERIHGYVEGVLDVVRERL